MKEKEIEIDYLIVGSGLAGAVLALTLLKHGKKIHVINNSTQPSSSGAAAGIFNPVTGRNTVKTWKADDVFPFLSRFYKDAEKLLKEAFLVEKPIFRIFSTPADQNNTLPKVDDSRYEHYLNILKNSAGYTGNIKMPFGGIEINGGGYLNVSAFLRRVDGYLKEHNLLTENTVTIHDLQIQPNHVRFSGIKARKIVFCEGPYAAQNSLFNWLPFAPVKGEIVEAEIPGLPETHIINKSIFILPVGEGRFKIGATYDRDDLSAGITENAKNYLSEKLENLLALPYRIFNQKTGIRPAVKDRRPIIGLHPKYSGIGIFNGFGSKGVSLAPYFAECFYQMSEHNKPLDPEADIKRFFHYI